MDPDCDLFFNSNNRDLPPVTLFNPKRVTTDRPHSVITSDSEVDCPLSSGSDMEGQSPMDGEEEEEDDDFLSFSSYTNDSDEKNRARGGGEVEGGEASGNNSNRLPHYLGLRVDEPTISTGGCTNGDLITLRYIPVSPMVEGKEEDGGSGSVTPRASPEQHSDFQDQQDTTVDQCEVLTQSALLVITTKILVVNHSLVSLTLIFSSPVSIPISPP